MQKTPLLTIIGTAALMGVLGWVGNSFLNGPEKINDLETRMAVVESQGEQYTKDIQEVKQAIVATNNNVSVLSGSVNELSGLVKVFLNKVGEKREDLTSNKTQ